jgi:hypothetical protein
MHITTLVTPSIALELLPSMQPAFFSFLVDFPTF